MRKYVCTLVHAFFDNRVQRFEDHCGSVARSALACVGGVSDGDLHNFPLLPTRLVPQIAVGDASYSWRLFPFRGRRAGQKVGLGGGSFFPGSAQMLREFPSETGDRWENIRRRRGEEMGRYFPIFKEFFPLEGSRDTAGVGSGAQGLGKKGGVFSQKCVFTVGSKNCAAAGSVRGRSLVGGADWGQLKKNFPDSSNVV